MTMTMINDNSNNTNRPKAVLSEDGIVMSRMIDIIKLLTDIRLQDKELWNKIVEFQMRRNI